MARKVTLGFDFRLNGSILSMAAIVASDSVPSMSASVIMRSQESPLISLFFAKASAKWGTVRCHVQTH